MDTQPLSTQRDKIAALISVLEKTTNQADVEAKLAETFECLPDNLVPDSACYYSILNFHLYQYSLKHYKHKKKNVCLWRYIKNLSDDQLNYKTVPDPELKMLDHLVRLYFYSGPLDDLTCLFIPVSDQRLIKKHLEWIQSYFYDVNYPTSLLWLYALDSSLASLFPNEIIYLGTRTDDDFEDIIIPNFTDEDAVLLKRYSNKNGHYVALTGRNATSEFRQIFTFLRQEYKDRCLSRSGKQEEDVDQETYQEEWEKFEDVLKFGVSDKSENGCISFSDLRSSTEFLNTYGKVDYLNKVQQPFFEKTKLISREYNGRIDKFMGDNVMCVFLNNNMHGKSKDDRENEAVLHNLFAVFTLCKVLFEIIQEHGYLNSKLGLRSGLTYGSHILRSNLGNEIVRDFTVTGETVNLAARLEHISIQELIINNQMYFKDCIDRFPHIRQLVSIEENYPNLNTETRNVVQQFSLYQNLISNLEKLKEVKFDIRFNQRFYFKLREHFINVKRYPLLNEKTAHIHGFEEFNVEGFNLRFYFSYYNPKGFSDFEKIWILPFEFEVLENLKIEMIK